MLRWLAPAAIALALALAAQSGCNKSKNEAVPAEVDVQWPDAAGFPPRIDAKKAPDAGAQPGSTAGDGAPEAAPAAPEAPAEPAPSMSSGSDG